MAKKKSKGGGGVLWSKPGGGGGDSIPLGELASKYHPFWRGLAEQSRAKEGAARERAAGFEKAVGEYSQVKQEYEPYKQLGKESVSAVQKLFGDPGSVKGLPGYQFRFEQGQGAIENVAGKKGQLFGGNTLQELVRYGQEYATSEYDNELKRRMGASSMGLQATKMFDESSLNMADLYVGQGQSAARQYDQWGKYVAGHEQAGRENFNSWFGGSGGFSSMMGGMGG